MEVVVDFLTDASKIIFGSAVVGFFIPGLSGEITATMFFGGISATMVFLTLAAILSRKIQKI
ncbi:MAG: hypothetical protein HYV66_01035 [Candidatus Sungbacteria bacterium]|uniref:Uncharacterized protein n=1 Tax=Candidatus Sungiibacteriota bacterium TaxID=2750080 RepID=A0A931YDB3_9BACT|nr:hypothetical protein [Candidatus Sungbacteria bacterium]